VFESTRCQDAIGGVLAPVFRLDEDRQRGLEFDGVNLQIMARMRYFQMNLLP
jgi:hypothetical protein